MVLLELSILAKAAKVDKTERERERERERVSLLVEVDALVQPLTQVLDPQVTCHIHLPVEQGQGARFLGTRGARGFGEGGGGGDVRVGGALLLPWRLGR